MYIIMSISFMLFLSKVYKYIVTCLNMFDKYVKCYADLKKLIFRFFVILEY